jgi:hypothetical protein
MLACERITTRVFVKNFQYYCDTFPLVAKVFTIVFASEPFPRDLALAQPVCDPP